MIFRKLFLVLSGVLWVICLNAGDLSFTLESSFSYDNNVYELSDEDLTDYDEGLQDFNYIDTSDDLTCTNSLRLRYGIEKKKHEFFFSFTPEYSYYTSNPDKSAFSFLASAGLISKINDVTLSYGYYPDNYLRKYTDNDGTDVLEKYDYEKSLYKLSGNLRFLKNSYFLYYSKYEQYYYNKFFTEYDGDAYTLGAGYKHSFNSFYLELMYYYKNMETDNHISDASDVTDWSKMENFRDASYESNILSVSFLNKKVGLGKKVSIRPYLTYDIEMRYYNTDLPVSYYEDVDTHYDIDQIHSSRKDEIYDLTLGTEAILKDNFNITLDYKHTYRKVSSDNKDLAEIKDYQRDRVTLGFKYDFHF